MESVKSLKMPSLESEKEDCNNNESKCHGQIKDLELFVPAKWWKNMFSESLYLKMDSPYAEDPKITENEVNLLESIPAIKNLFSRICESEGTTKIMDLCCGQGRHSIYISKKYPHLSLFGHDYSPYLIDVAKERASAQNLTSTFFTVGESRQIPYNDNTFDLVLHLGNSFGYFPTDDEDKVVLAEIKRVLAPGGYFVLDVSDGNYIRSSFEERSWTWLDDSTIVCRQRQLSKDNHRLISRAIMSSTTKGVIADWLYQVRLYSRSELNEMITEAGFLITATPQEEITSTIVSDLNKPADGSKDVGMMSRRISIVAKKS